MSTEYFTNISYEEGKAKLLANLGDFTYEDRSNDEQPHYIPECKAFGIRAAGRSYLWFTCETRDYGRRCFGKWGKDPDIPTGTGLNGTLAMERFGIGGNPVEVFMPWIEQTLGCKVVSECGLPWELDQ